MRAELEFDSFYAATRPRLLQQLTIITLDREQAQDAMQEAYASSSTTTRRPGSARWPIDAA